MKKTIKYTAAMLLVSASLNAYGAPEVSVSGRVKSDIGSTKAGNANWSSHNINLDRAQISLDIKTKQFDVKLTLDAAEWYENSISVDGDLVKNNSKNLERLLEEASIKFKTANGEITLGKQDIILIPNFELSSLTEADRKEQVIGVRFTTKGKALLNGIGIDAAFYETESHDNSIGDEFGFNVILSKDINKNLKAYLALQSEEQASGSRHNTVIARGVYTISPELTVSAQYKDAKTNSSLTFGAEYKLASDLALGASYDSTSEDDMNADDSTEIKLYGSKQVSESTAFEVYWSNKTVGSGDTAVDNEAVGMRFDVKF